MEASNVVPDSLLRELRASRVVCSIPQGPGRAPAFPLKQKALAVALTLPRVKSLVVWLGRG